MDILNLINTLSAGSTMCYIDPAATSVLLSSITAIVIAVGASAIIIWRKMKKKVSKSLHIDPNSGKEVEEEIVVTDEEVLNSAAEKTEAPAEEKPAEPAKEEKPAAKTAAKKAPAKSAATSKTASSKTEASAKKAPAKKTTTK